MASALEGNAESTLVASAGACLAARLDLGALGKVLAQARDVLVVDFLDVIDAEPANLAARNIAVAAARATTWASTATAAGAISTTATGAISTTAATGSVATAAARPVAATFTALPESTFGARSAFTVGASLLGGTLRSTLRCGLGLRRGLVLSRGGSAPVVYIFVISHFSILILPATLAGPGGEHSLLEES